jgi:predicted transcriptional regulator
LARLLNIVGVRLSDEDVEKLDQLAEQTFRGRGDVVRLLIHEAQAAKRRDVFLSEAAPVSADETEPAHVG